MTTSICAIVVTYEPGTDLLSNINTYIDHVDEVIVIDNSEQQDSAMLEQQLARTNISVLPNHQNLGIAAALNIGARLAIEKGYKWMLTMDQDSAFEENTITKYMSCFHQMKSNQIGMLGLEFNPNKLERSNTTNCLACNVDCLITSGSIVNLLHWKALNGFNENLFIDGVDDEYCMRLIRNQLQVRMMVNLQLNHQLGNDVLVRNWHIGPLVKRNIHSPVRLYYMVRNYLYLIRHFKKDFPEKTREYQKVLINKIKNNLLYHPQRASLLRHIFKGWKDYKSHRMGKIKY